MLSIRCAVAIQIDVTNVALAVGIAVQLPGVRNLRTVFVTGFCGPVLKGGLSVIALIFDAIVVVIVASGIADAIVVTVFLIRIGIERAVVGSIASGRLLAGNAVVIFIRGKRARVRARLIRCRHEALATGEVSRKLDRHIVAKILEPANKSMVLIFDVGPSHCGELLAEL